jgi:crotonobetainyl-CoA:carnitine CoA-transferase CaiB-like acyl-CoA transferase
VHPGADGPLSGVRVLDFSTLLPGPLATLLLAEAGATVTKVERPGGGDEMRSYDPPLGDSSVIFALLNRGKRSVEIDLKAPESRSLLEPLIAEADVLVEQFRPGVMARLGLGYDDVAEINPHIVYCSITGFGQDGPRAQVAAHDINYLGEAGMLDLTRDGDGNPVIPHAPIADIGGGAYPAVMNILLALRDRDRTGTGCHVDVAMADNVLTWMYWAIGGGQALGRWPRPGGELMTGGSPRYALYRTADGRHIAAAPVEDRFWATFCDVIDLPAGLRDDEADPAATRSAVAERIAAQPAEHWARRFSAVDACCSVVRTVQEAASSPEFAARGLWEERTADTGGADLPALPVPLDPGLRRPPASPRAPALGEHTPVGQERG